MEATAVYSSKGSPFLCYSRITTKAKTQNSATFSPFLIQSMATQKPLPSVAKTVGSRKSSNTTVFPLGEPGPRNSAVVTQPVKLLTNVEKLKLLTKAEKAGLLSAAEKFGLSVVDRETRSPLQGGRIWSPVRCNRPWDSRGTLDPELGFTTFGSFLCLPCA
ncbi:hypothetical protein CRYUN_Cryun19dG0028400 [Craigia yunnanensis]